MLIILGYLAAVLMGVVLGTIGGGGSILTVPILVYLMGVSPDVATGYSLLIVGTTAAFGAYRYVKQGLVDIKASLLFALPSIIAVYLTRAYVMPSLPEVLINEPVTVSKNTAIMLLFALLMLTSACMMLRKAKKSIIVKNTTGQLNQSPAKFKSALIIVEGAVVGVVTGVLGAGGGFLIIPALVLFVGMPMKNAVGASLLIIALKSLIGFTGDLQAGIVLEVPLLPLMLVATLVGMVASTHIAKQIAGELLQRLFAYFTLIIAIVIITKEMI
ncbi:sulfite exporter TauE/SafE family protein [Neptunicella marina]|uniref:Probable membrane transporter protein n=1 Tax=Neptunicella marina TaxID=2125989 RepID=A0A8J6M0V6_9ALTE|nr:sulfite exporter TauE/SafE family protein [Neptunicella marina]MBC3767750.1 sulfite exporter TauE/SafE family protein [Neptunicella marina]